MENLIDMIRDAGIVGAGGAGFPTHVKVNCKADYVIANGAECEPLLRGDQQLMARYTDLLVSGTMAVAKHTGAAHTVIAVKAHYEEAVEALERSVKGTNIEVRTFGSFYPLGDEQTLVYEITGRVVPTGGLPLDVGAIVSNVATLINIGAAIKGKPVTHKAITVGGQVSTPVTLMVPIGTSIRELLKVAGAPEYMTDYTIILGGPCMGKITDDLDTPVTKTMGGVLVFPKDHPLIAQKTRTVERDIKLARAVCCQCSMCTQICPRNALGLNVQPHKAMRAMASGLGKLFIEANGVFSCCDCGVCTYYGCNFGLSPSRLMQEIKMGLLAKGVKPKKEVAFKPDDAISLKRLPMVRLIGRLGIRGYDVPAPLETGKFKVGKVCIPLNMHIGAPAESVVQVGVVVKEGDLIGKIKDGALGATVHASIAGCVTEVGANITIEA